MIAPRFLWNGIKVDGGELIRVHYSDGEIIGSPAGTLTIYARDYGRRLAKVPGLVVLNDSDCGTDYFETDRARVEPGHPYYADVLAALNASKEHASRLVLSRARKAYAAHDARAYRRYFAHYEAQYAAEHGTTEGAYEWFFDLMTAER